MSGPRVVKIPDDGGDTMTMTDLGNGTILPMFHPPEQMMEIFENIPNLTCRDDDYMLCTFGKTGTSF